MKKIIKNLVLALTLVAAGFTGSVLSANAETLGSGWTVTYNGKSDVDFTSTYKDDYKPVQGAMPGDTISYTIQYKNNTTESADFYMNADVLNSLEEGNVGGAYSYKITNNGSELFDSETIGGDATAAVGLKQVSGDDGLYFSLGTIPANGSGKVVVAIKLDGDSQPNIYGDKDAALAFFFKAESTENAEKHKTIINNVTKTNTITKQVAVSEKKTIVKQIVKTLDNGTELVTIDDSDVPLAGGNPSTGDSIVVMAICSALFVLGMMLIIYAVAMGIIRKKEVA